ncbi:MAG: hypothetical protein PHS25_11830, partial [Proteiniphilum sp.]|nr:hypothetical protein [Proteiniphilum sp.]
MKQIVTLLFFVIGTVFMASATNNKNKSEKSDIIIENEQFKLVIGRNAIAKSLVLKSNNEECLMKGENIAIFSVTQERPYHNEIKLAHPNKKTTFPADTIYREGDKLIVGFELIPYQAIIQIKETPAYVGFSLYDFITDGIYPGYLKITPPPASEVTILQLPIRDRKNFGEWLNVSWDHKAAVNVLGTDAY